MAVALEKTYVVNNLSRGLDGMTVNLAEHNDDAPVGVVYYPGSGVGNLTVHIAEADAAKFLPGQLFKLSLTPVKNA